MRIIKFHLITNVFLTLGFLFYLALTPLGVSYAEENDNSQKSQNSIKKKFVQANLLLQKGKYDKAARAFAYLYERSQGEIKQHSLELLAVSYEESKRIAQAKSTFEQYLAIYKEGDGHERVRQRLAHLIESQIKAKPPLSLASNKRTSHIQTRHRGSLSQYFYSNSNNYDNGKFKQNHSHLYTFLNSDWRKRSASSEFRTVLSMRMANDLLQKNDGPLNIKKAYVSYRSSNFGLNTRIGRQGGYMYGVSGYVDGITAGAALSNHFSSNFVYGAPVSYIYRDSINPQEQLYGANLIYTSSEHLQIESYVLKQSHDGFDNRSAIGTSFNWRSNTFRLYSSTDYDFKFQEFNLFMIQSEMNLDRLSIYVNYDNRRSPFIEASTALLAITSIDDMDLLHQMYSDDQIKKLANDLTGKTQRYHIGTNYKHNSKFSVKSELIYSQNKLSYMGSDNQLQKNSEESTALNFKVVNKNSITNVNTANLRLMLSNHYNAIGTQWYSRYKLSRRWSFLGKLFLNYRKTDLGEIQNQIYPAFNINVKTGKKMQLNFDIGHAWINYSGNTMNRNYQRNFINIGYILLF